MTSKKSIAIAAVASVALSGCLAGDIGPEYVPLVQPGTQTGRVVFSNPTEYPVVSLRFNPHDRMLMGSADFGVRRLDGGTIEPGQSRQFTVSRGCYHMNAMTGGTELLSVNLEDIRTFCVLPNETTTVRVRRP